MDKSVRPEIRELIESRSFSKLRGLLAELRPPEISDIITHIADTDEGSNADNAIVFRLLPHKVAAEVFEYLDLDIQKNLLNTLATNQVARILDQMSPDDRTALLEELPSAAVTKLLGLLSSTERVIAQKLLGYPEESVGRLMTPEFIAIKKHWTVSETLNYIRKSGRDSETLNVIYVVDDNGVLIDDLRIRELLLADPEAYVSSIMNNSFIALRTDQSQADAISVFKKYNRVALPVVDTLGELVGIVTIDDILAIAEEQSTEDMLRFGGTGSLSEAYIDTSIFEMVRKRGAWLVVLFFGELFTAEALGFFEDTISKVAILAIFIPLITSSGGNAGSQAATLIIRGMAVGELSLSDWFKVMRREFLSGLLLGLSLGILGFLRASLKSTETTIHEHQWLELGLIVGASLVSVVVWGTLIGSMLPFILRKLNFDPATSSGPAVATIVDVTGIIIYFSFATLLLQQIL